MRTSRLPEALRASVEAKVEDWCAGDKVRRFWQHDALPCTGADEANWMGWLDVTTRQPAASGCALWRPR
ncbi:MAG: hypothetical protein WA637_18330 [Terriglobales bacterium]